MIFLFKIVAAFLSSVGFALMFNLPKKLLFYSGFVGAIGYLGFELYSTNNDVYILSYLFSAVLIGIFGEIFASLTHNPSTVFTIPGIIPIVPGFTIYYTMFYLVQNKFNLAVEKGAESIFIAIAIACGIAISTSVMRKIRPYLDKLIKIKK